MILRRVIAHVRNQEWAAIAIDFVIVVLGVFIGIQVSNWNENRALRERERTHLEQLLIDLESDRTTGERINPYGANIRLGRHVWLGRDVVITGHSDVGDGVVIGHGSLVRGQKVPAHTAVAGSPARVLRENVAWRHEDQP